MRRLSRIRAPLQRLQATHSHSDWQCPRCRLQAQSASPFTTSIRHRRDTKSSELKEKEVAFPGDEKPYEIEDSEIKDVALPQVPEMLTPATTWDGLAWVGTPQWIKEKRAAKYKIERFADLKRKVTSVQAIKDATTKSFIEILAFREQNIPLSTIAERSPHYQWPKEDIRLEIDGKTGRPSVKYDSASAKDALLQAIQSDSETITSVGERVPVGTANSALFNRISILDPELKFALYKRTHQRTGILLSDAALSKANTLGALLEILQSRPPAKKLADEARFNAALGQLPNVEVSKKRVGIVKKEQKVGRWKIIEQELLDRGLPVHGPAL
ncbi:hypothetical protein EJ08DRAFT_681342 [Tothia fuscella]|uniref:Large ribosomal subunit protein mL50 n=1 Tax=Tothia fuscella TaxID=1048955 RepID=A0A9P4TUZ5_9PEZI|nr:hypothetical protein EJ08DRAFT_681342 [Tothia fuscella]